MKTYETVIILNDRLVQDEGKAFAEEFSSKISGAGGKIIKSTPLGRKQFAREIKKQKTGNYWDFIVDLPEKEIQTFPDAYKLDERVLRFQAFIYDRPEKPEEVNLNKEKSEVKDISEKEKTVKN